MQDFPLPEDVNRAIDLLQASGFEAYLVGGCVRDMLMGKTPSDYDLASSATPEELCHIFQDFRVIKTGIVHGTVTVLLGDFPMEITTFRAESEYTDGRRPDEVRFGVSLQEDLARRDFTMNAMAYHPSFGIIDPYEGKRDLTVACIRCVGRADERFREDGLRILRALRFASVLGFSLVEETANALRRQSQGLLRIAVERIRVELERLLCGVDAPKIFLEYVDVLELVLPELMNRTGDTDEWLRETALALSYTQQEAILRWSVLLHTYSAEMVDSILRRLRFDRKSRERVVGLIKEQDATCIYDESAILRSMSRQGEEFFFQLLQLQRGIQLARSCNFHATLMQYDEIETRARHLLAESPCLTRKDLAVRGEDLLGLGLSGANVGKELNELLENVLNREVKNEKEILLSRIQEKMKAN